jgi:hypothetical protein
MATNIDKALNPNDLLVEEGPEIELEPLGEELEYELAEEEMNEDGSVVVDFDPNGDEEGGEDEHSENLADKLTDEVLTGISDELVQAYKDDRETRDPWEKAYIKGISLMGLNIENRSQPWAGASGVFHPILTEAVIKFQADAMNETFPASGPVMTRITGKADREREKQSKRVRKDMNYQ